jgi:DHA1 family inner membrane transport protein
MDTKSSTPAPGEKPVARAAIVLAALTLGAFAVGTSEFMVGGVLNEVARSLGVPIPAAGLLISGYAAGVTVGGPLMTMLTGRLERRYQISLLLGIFVAGNLLCAISTSFAWLLLGRLVTAFCHGAFYGAASIAAGSLVPPGQRARAVALVSSGVMIANIFGVPAGAGLAQLLGWQASFWAVGALGGLAGLLLLLILPPVRGSGRPSLRAEARALSRPEVVVGLLLSFCFTAGLFTCVPYLTPMLTDLAHAPADLIPWLLMVFGCGATAGMLLGGRLADWRLRPTLAIAFGAQGVTYLLLALTGSQLTAMWGTVFLLGASAMLALAPLRMMVLEGAADAPGLAATMTSSAFNLGAATGAALGSALLATGLGYAALPIVAIGFAAAATAVLRPVAILRNVRGSIALPSVHRESKEPCRPARNHKRARRLHPPAKAARFPRLLQGRR